MNKTRVNEIGKVFEWENQSKQYPLLGKGIMYFKGNLTVNRWVDCLLYYGDDYSLQGILNYYSFDFLPFERKGNVTIQVREDKRRTGIATSLLDEAMSMFQINLYQQKYTLLGKKFIMYYIAYNNGKKNVKNQYINLGKT